MAPDKFYYNWVRVCSTPAASLSDEIKSVLLAFKYFRLMSGNITAIAIIFIGDWWRRVGGIGAGGRRKNDCGMGKAINEIEIKIELEIKIKISINSG